MTSRPWYAFYPKDYQQKAAHLTMLQHGAYRLLLDHYYASAKPLPANADGLHRVCRAFASDEQAAIAFVLAEFFVLDARGYTQDRVEEELKKADALSETRRKAAKTRYSDPVQLQSKSTANAGHLHTQSQSQSQIEDTSLRSVSSAPAKAVARQRKPKDESEHPAFQEFYEKYPRREGRRTAARAFKAALARGSPEAIMAGSARYAVATLGSERQFVKLPATWLNGDHWKDEITEGTASNGHARKPTAHDNFLAGIANALRKSEDRAAANGSAPLDSGELGATGRPLLEAGLHRDTS